MKYPHYFKPVPAGATHIDVYRVLQMFNVTDPCIAHAVKKLLVAGGRGAKDAETDIREAIVSLDRWSDMRAEEAAPAAAADDGWIEWGGGECPVGVYERVLYRLREGYEGTACGSDMLRWSHEGLGSDIIAYRIIK